jgi:hypothetical protein
VSTKSGQLHCNELRGYLIALVTFCSELRSISLGGGIYETLLVDPVWLRNLSVIQSDRGGLNRKLFWGSVHPLFEIALLVSVWMRLVLRVLYSPSASLRAALAFVLTHLASSVTGR